LLRIKFNSQKKPFKNDFILNVYIVSFVLLFIKIH
jgi:hypothetical protein